MKSEKSRAPGEGAIILFIHTYARGNVVYIVCMFYGFWVFNSSLTSSKSASLKEVDEMCEFATWKCTHPKLSETGLQACCQHWCTNQEKVGTKRKAVMC